MFEQEENLVAFPIAQHDGYNLLLCMMRCSCSALLRCMNFWLPNAMNPLGLQQAVHPTPYKLDWLKGDMTHNGRSSFFSFTFDNRQIMLIQRPEILPSLLPVSMIVPHLDIERTGLRNSVLFCSCFVIHVNFDALIVSPSSCTRFAWAITDDPNVCRNTRHMHILDRLLSHARLALLSHRHHLQVVMSLCDVVFIF